jgi:nitronate monooxygenase
LGSASTPALAAAVTNAGGLGGLGMWGRTAEQASRRIAGFRQQSGGSLNINYPIWPDPRCAPEITQAMQQHLQPQYDAHGLGPVPEPQGVVSDVGPEHVALLLETKPEAVSFHFGLPEPDVIKPIKSAGTFIISSATTVAEARLLEASTPSSRRAPKPADIAPPSPAWISACSQACSRCCRSSSMRSASRS